MTFLPIVERELRVAARRRGTYRTRLLMALGATVIGSSILVAELGASPDQLGKFLFESLAGLCLLHCLAVGRFATADSLSEEKREGTLGLLFLTDLRGLDVVLGKMAATSLHSFYGLLAVFPVLAVPLVIGGVTSGEFWRMSLVLADTFLFSLAIGIFVSSLCRDASRAFAGNFLMILLLVGALPACAGVLFAMAPAGPVTFELLLPCPGFAFYLCLDAPYKLHPEYFWISVSLIHAVTWLLVALACWIAPRSWQDRARPARAKRTGWRELWEAWSFGSVAKRAAFRKQLLDVNAFYWHAARARLKPAHVWTFLGLMALWWLFGVVTEGDVWFDESVAITTTLILNCALKLWITLEAGHRLAEDQKIGALELLLTTPLSERDILRGQFLALRRQFLWPLVLVMVVDVTLVFPLIGKTPHSESELILTWLAGVAMLAADAVALSLVAMSVALTAKSPNHAIVSAVTRVLMVPWLLFGFISLAAILWSWLGSTTGWTPSWKFNLGWWFSLGVFTDVAFGWLAWRRLQFGFRRLAMLRFAPRQAQPLRWSAGKKAVAKASMPKPTEPKPLAPEKPSVAKKSWKKFALTTASAILLAVGCLYLALRPTPQVFAPPVVIALVQSNAPLHVFPSTGGVLFILPDSSLWQWGAPGGGGVPGAVTPEQIGTNHDWRQVRAEGHHWIGLREDGRLQEWGWLGPIRPPALPLTSSEPLPVGTNQNWTAVAAGEQHSVALRRDGTLWAWGDNSMNQLGSGAGPSTTNLVQVGKDTNWMAVSAQWNATVALRRDGSLWVWGQIPWFPGSQMASQPTRVCRETNWTELSSGGFPWARNRNGELWMLMSALPNPEAPCDEVNRRIATNTVSGRFALAYCGQPNLYELHPDGTLWEAAYPFGRGATGPATGWRRRGQRKDWVSLWGSGGTAFGLTADGTVWMWGVDFSQSSVPDFVSRIKLVGARIQAMIGAPPSSLTTSGMVPSQKEPRPLMRLSRSTGAAVEKPSTSGP